MNHQGSAERRRHFRYDLKKRLFITFRPDFERIGWVRNISEGGVSFEYCNLQESPLLPEKLQVDIFSSPMGFVLSCVSCKLVYDITVRHKKGFMACIDTRRCGLVFEKLSAYHAAQLDIILSGVRYPAAYETNDGPARQGVRGDKIGKGL